MRSESRPVRRSRTGGERLQPAPVPNWFDTNKVVSPELRAGAEATSRKVWELKWALVDLLEGAMPVAVELTKARDRVVHKVPSAKTRLHRGLALNVGDRLGGFIILRGGTDGAIAVEALERPGE